MIMSTHDQVTKLLAEKVLDGNVSITGTGLTGAIIDSKDFGSLTYVLNVAAVTAGEFTVVLEEGDDSGLSDAAVVPAGEVIQADGSTGATGGSALSITAAGSSGVLQVGDVGKLRYKRLRFVGDATADGDIGVVAIKGHPRSQPTS
jgi:hypothetical protein